MSLEKITFGQGLTLIYVGSESQYNGYSLGGFICGTLSNYQCAALSQTGDQSLSSLIEIEPINDNRAQWGKPLSNIGTTTIEVRIRNPYPLENTPKANQYLGAFADDSRLYYYTWSDKKTTWLMSLGGEDSIIFKNKYYENQYGFKPKSSSGHIDLHQTSVAKNDMKFKVRSWG